MQGLINFIENTFSHDLSVLILSMFPFIEAKGSIPIAMAFDIPFKTAIMLAYIGSMIPVPFLLWFFKPFLEYIGKFAIFSSFIDGVFRKAMRKGKKVRTMGELAIVVFVAIPIPGTGVWMGSLIARLFDIRLKRAFCLIAVGNLIAVFVIAGLSFGVIHVIN